MTIFFLIQAWYISLHKFRVKYIHSSSTFNFKYYQLTYINVLFRDKMKVRYVCCVSLCCWDFFKVAELFLKNMNKNSNSEEILVTAVSFWLVDDKYSLKIKLLGMHFSLPVKLKMVDCHRIEIENGAKDRLRIVKIPRLDCTIISFYSPNTGNIDI